MQLSRRAGHLFKHRRTDQQGIDQQHRDPHQNKPAPPNRHSTVGFDHRLGTRRGFLPRGLCDTCPHSVEDRRAYSCAGQVSHKPKHGRTLGDTRDSADPGCIAAHPGHDGQRLWRSPRRLPCGRHERLPGQAGRPRRAVSAIAALAAGHRRCTSQPRRAAGASRAAARLEPAPGRGGGHRPGRGDAQCGQQHGHLGAGARHVRQDLWPQRCRLAGPAIGAESARLDDHLPHRTRCLRGDRCDNAGPAPAHTRARTG